MVDLKQIIFTIRQPEVYGEGLLLQLFGIYDNAAGEIKVIGIFIVLVYQTVLVVIGGNRDGSV